MRAGCGPLHARSALSRTLAGLRTWSGRTRRSCMACVPRPASFLHNSLSAAMRRTWVRGQPSLPATSGSPSHIPPPTHLHTCGQAPLSPAQRFACIMSAAAKFDHQGLGSLGTVVSRFTGRGRGFGFCFFWTMKGELAALLQGIAATDQNKLLPLNMQKETKLVMRCCRFAAVKFGTNPAKGCKAFLSLLGCNRNLLRVRRTNLHLGNAWGSRHG